MLGFIWDPEDKESPLPEFLNLKKKNQSQKLLIKTDYILSHLNGILTDTTQCPEAKSRHNEEDQENINI